jgi:hypothetical protein
MQIPEARVPESFAQLQSSDLQRCSGLVALLRLRIGLSRQVGATVMALPKFDIHVMLACHHARLESNRKAEAASIASPPYSLLGVSYTFWVEPHQEPPFAVEEFWIYLRLVCTNNAAGERKLGLRVLAVNDDNTRTNVSPNGIIRLGAVRFSEQSPVVSFARPIRKLEVPRKGRYELRVYVKRNKPSIRGKNWRWVGSHHIMVEK